MYVHLSTYFELCCAVSLSVKLFSSPPSSAVCAEWEGEGDVDYGVFAKECAVERRHSDGKGRIWETTGRHHQSRAELGPMPTWVVRMVAGVVLGSGRVPGEGWPLFDYCSMSSRMLLNQGLGFVLAP